jgi:hypothetical protein
MDRGSRLIFSCDSAQDCNQLAGTSREHLHRVITVFNPTTIDRIGVLNCANDHEGHVYF